MSNWSFQSLKRTGNTTEWWRIVLAYLRPLGRVCTQLRNAWRRNEHVSLQVLQNMKTYWAGWNWHWGLSIIFVYLLMIRTENRVTGRLSTHNRWRLPYSICLALCTYHENMVWTPRFIIFVFHATRLIGKYGKLIFSFLFPTYKIFYFSIKLLDFSIRT